MSDQHSNGQPQDSELEGQQSVPLPDESAATTSVGDGSVSELKPRAFSIRELSFMGPSNDGTRLLLVDGDGNQFELPVDNRLISVVSREHAPKPKISKDSATPSPREIQHRVRHGATVADIASAAAVSEEHIARFAHPVLTERQHIADQAKAVIVSVTAGQVSLQDAIVSRIEDRGITADLLRWDAWRREDGAWTVSVAYPATTGEQVATFTYNTTEATIDPVGDSADWLLEQAATGPRSVPSLPQSERAEPTATTRQAESTQTQGQTSPQQEQRRERGEDQPVADRARSWDRAHPAAKAHERRGAAAEQDQRGPLQVSTPEADRRSQSGATSETARSPEPQQPNPPNPPKQPQPAPVAEKQEPEPPQWEELLFGSPKEGD